VVVVTCVHVHVSDAEERTKVVEYVDASSSLYDHEVVTNLIAGLVALSVLSVRLSDEADGEASFSVYETTNPFGIDRSFLLIVWLIDLASMNASRIVASHLTTDIGRSLTEHLRIRQVFQQMVEFL
jgi:hypothetical protein